MDEFDEFGNPIGGDEGQWSDESDVEFDEFGNEVPRAAAAGAVSAPVATKAALPLVTPQAAAAATAATAAIEPTRLAATRDTQLLVQPVIAPAAAAAVDTALPATTYSKEYLAAMLAAAPLRCRSVALVGASGAGKTRLVDMLVHATHPDIGRPRRKAPLRFSDTTSLEQARGVSLRATPVTLLLPDLQGRSCAVTVVDAPGNLQFPDQLAMALDTATTALVVVDAVEGVVAGTEAAIDAALQRARPIRLVLLQIDRLVLELKLPPADAYLKLRHTVAQVNAAIARLAYAPATPPSVTPTDGLVVFALGQYEFAVLLPLVAAACSSQCGVDVQRLAPLLWGDVYHDPELHRFVAENPTLALKRTFVLMVLEPLYKVVHAVLVGDVQALRPLVWDGFGVAISRTAVKDDADAVLRAVLGRVHGPGPLVDLLGLPQDDVSASVSLPVVAQFTGLFPASSPSLRPLAVVRVVQGTLHCKSSLRLVSAEGETPVAVSLLMLPAGRYHIPTASAGPGAVVLVSSALLETTPYGWLLEAPGFEPPPRLRVPAPAFKVSVEPVVQTTLPQMLELLGRAAALWPGVVVRAEATGEHVVYAAGETAMDAVLHQVRQEVAVRVLDPCVGFAESCGGVLATKTAGTLPDGRCEVSMVAEPIGAALAHALARGLVDLGGTARQVSRRLRQYGVDAFAARRVLAVLHDVPCVLVDDTMPDLEAHRVLRPHHASLVQGFRWGVGGGPLCDEPMGYVQFRIIDAAVDAQALALQLVGCVRKAMWQALMVAGPQLREPVYRVDVLRTKQLGPSGLKRVLARRRGEMVEDRPVPASPLYHSVCVVPVLDSVGLETDLRLGGASCQVVVEGYEVVPGDPLSGGEAAVQTVAVEEELARDFVLKTRRRKGLGVV